MKNNLKQLISTIMIFGLILTGLTSTILNGQAESDLPNPLMQAFIPTLTPMPEISTYNKSATFTFKEIGYENLILNYPDTGQIYVNLPDYWNTTGSPNQLNLRYDLEVADTNPSQKTTSTPTAADRRASHQVDIFINDTYTDSFFPSAGINQNVQINIPPQILATVTDSTNNPEKGLSISFRFYEGADMHCDEKAILTIYNDSKFTVSFVAQVSIRDLSLVPRLLVQGSFLPETLLFVIPDQYTEDDLTATANIASFVGAAGLGNVKYKVLTASQATQKVLTSSSAILIGQPSKNALIADLYNKKLLPTTLGSDGIIKKGDTALAKEEGVVQIIPSPVNDLNSFLVISGNSDSGIILASQELNKTTRGISSNAYIFRPSEALVLPPLQPQGATAYKVTFDKLNFRTSVFQGIGTTNSFLSFYVPRNWDIQPGGKLTVTYNHSSRLNPSNSALSISLNGILISSVPFDKTIQGDRTVEINLDPRNLTPGTINTITFSATRKADINCTVLEPSLYWITLRDTGTLNIPYKLITNPNALAPLSNPFYYLANEAYLLLSVPQKPTSEDLDSIATIVSSLSSISRIELPLNVIVTTNSDIDLQKYKGYNLLIYGRPTQNGYLAKINDNLIQQFAQGEDSLRQKKVNIEVHTPQDIDIGVVQAFSQKADLFRGVTVVSGTTSNIVQFTAAIASESFFRFDRGDLFYVGLNNTVLSYISSVNIGSIQEIVTSVVQTTKEAVVVVPTATTIPPLMTVSPPPSKTNFLGISLDSNMLLLGVIGAGLLIILIGVLQMLRNWFIKR